MYSGQTEHPRDEFITLYIYSEGTGTEFLEHNSETRKCIDNTKKSTYIHPMFED